MRPLAVFDLGCATYLALRGHPCVGVRPTRSRRGLLYLFTRTPHALVDFGDYERARTELRSIPVAAPTEVSDAPERPAT
jgi:hypothetical protein